MSDGLYLTQRQVLSFFAPRLSLRICILSYASEFVSPNLTTIIDAWISSPHRLSWNIILCRVSVVNFTMKYIFPSFDPYFFGFSSQRSWNAAVGRPVDWSKMLNLVSITMYLPFLYIFPEFAKFFSGYVLLTLACDPRYYLKCLASCSHRCNYCVYQKTNKHHFFQYHSKITIAHTNRPSGPRFWRFE